MAVRNDKQVARLTLSTALHSLPYGLKNGAGTAVAAAMSLMADFVEEVGQQFEMDQAGNL
jgi:hypothetical protein